ncbi:dTDP-4-dehydrorhamnose reductase [Tessaracoccus aquimaris]|uniref:dTDP-4-dehydrorhamnose reductase n=1 Tax=Tessaracoccus aquimaris TaxID=1332264 RepID=A0A1Q2CSE1_9ACTN|nr:bifunctional dTDP-4-dehydrorhamnose 3,5-epimerase family protein/NAD(P)-dependent oxidoreductase [Tessaracoccus aquimaris]AQP49017.1 dTDP-4-dehydrorhamnose reductase [Tessaracoccus aquimaris]
MSELVSRESGIPGLLFLDLPVREDARGWFKENWQRAKMTALGLPDFGPVQHNIAFNAAAGTTRGMHAEPWDKLVSLAAGRIFGVWVDLRPGPGFGTVATREMGPEGAVFVPRGVANGYQALEEGTLYSYLVNEHWSAEALALYTYVNLADPSLAIDWPIPLAEAEISDADRAHPALADVTPMAPRATVILGGSGQLGRELVALLPDAVAPDRTRLDLTSAESVAAYDWSQVGTIINAAAFTEVDGAETQEGAKACWSVNVNAVARLVDQARRHRIRFVQVSSDYVFDGTAPVHDEYEAASPLSTYGASKAASDALVATLPEHLIVRTTWLVGTGRSFVATMAALADRGASPRVVDDQFGRLSFADDLAAAIVHLLSGGAGSGVYNVTNAGPTRSWADIARRVFELSGRDPGDVQSITSEEWAEGRVVADRPRNSALSLDRLEATGFRPRDADERLVDLLTGRQ